MRAAISLLVLAGCFYAPNSYHGAVSAFSGKRVPLGCIDLAVGLTDDERAPGTIVEYSFGNSCLHAVTVDLSAVRAIVYNDATPTGEVHPYDPKHELKPLRLDALWYGRERISYQGAAGDVICLDVGPIAGQPSQWVCLGARVGGAT
jgi:hypothetical protein